MTNWEKYKDKILNTSTMRFCTDFCEPILKKEFGKECKGFSCDKCRIAISCWLQEEYKEPEVDWSKVEVDTQILVRGSESQEWSKKYFAKYKDGKVFAWDNGKTSWTSNCCKPWRYAKLAERNGED